MFRTALCPSGLFLCCRRAGKPTCFADCCGSLIFSIKSEGEQEERGSCDSAYSFNLQLLRRCGDALGLVVLAISPPVNDKSTGVSVVLQVSV